MGWLPFDSPRASRPRTPRLLFSRGKNRQNTLRKLCVLFFAVCSANVNTVRQFPLPVLQPKYMRHISKALALSASAVASIESSPKI